MDLITSRQNPKVKQARALKSRRGRDRSGMFLVEGLHPVGAALEAAAPVEALFYAPDLLTSPFGQELLGRAARLDLPCHPTTAEVFASLAEKEGPQGILGVVRQNIRPLDDLEPGTHPWLAALVEPQDPGNLGAVMRTAEAAGASGLILVDGGVDAHHPTAVRASMGALFWLPVAAGSGQAFAAWLDRHTYHVYGTSAHAHLDYREIVYTQPAILLAGSEREGLSPRDQAWCHHLVRLPMRGHTTSLNLAVAVGVMLYHMQEDWSK